jgi:hypothetical protein
MAWAGVVAQLEGVIAIAVGAVEAIQEGVPAE